ncbi:tRNA (guanine-N7-)-methyltransferase [Microbacterium immunditiarum]|uniref:tRNA (guanine-N(7)-)-methyltransferase n=2 Tax=Microbacterium immunditiarum TaxID=337480 RepID=A0A7Y9GQV8_9MICO|nr:tRNA (guanine-N7-)-methyltransferase [Microbacterium immunditiarum]
MTETPSPPRVFRDRPVSFVRRSGRMSDAQERAWSELAPRYVIEVPRDAAATSVAAGAAIDPAAVWGREAPLVVEIGSGQGHAIVHAATSRPEWDFLAIEVFKAGLARTMLDAERAGARNLRLVEANAPEVLEKLLPEASVSELWVFFPDPWHKKKHTKRRLVTPEFAELAARALRDGGTLRLATDWEDYALQMRDVLDEAEAFEKDFEGEWADRYEGRALTAFERKGARAGRGIRDLAYRRLAR